MTLNLSPILEPAELEDALRPGSVVAPTYKVRYAERAYSRKAKPTAADKRGCADWLQRRLAELTLEPKTFSLRVADFEAILDANGVAHSHWNRTTRGWQGRLRMTGRLALQRVVAETGLLALPFGEPLQAPKAWCERTKR